MLPEATNTPIVGSGFSGIKAIMAGMTTIAVAHPVAVTAVTVWLGTTAYWVLKTRSIRKEAKIVTANNANAA